MAIQGIGGAGIGAVTGAGAPQRTVGEKFSTTLKAQTGRAQVDPPRSELAPLEAQPHRAEARATAQPGKARVDGGHPPRQVKPLEPAKMIDHVAAAQKRMDAVLELAQSGKSFTPAELLSLQTQMYRASQELDLAGKVVEKATGGVKQILQTQV